MIKLSIVVKHKTLTIQWKTLQEPINPFADPAQGTVKWAADTTGTKPLPTSGNKTIAFISHSAESVSHSLM